MLSGLGVPEVKDEKIREITAMFLSFRPMMRKSYNFPAPPPPGKKTARMNLSMYSLLLLKQNGRLSMGRLAKELGVSSQQLTAIVAPLADKGLVERSTDPANRRLVYVAITDAGIESLDKMRMYEEDRFAKSFSVLSEEDLDRLIFHFRKVLEILGKTGRPESASPEEEES